MKAGVVVSYLFGRVSRNIVFWLLSTVVLHTTSGIFFPNYVALVCVMFLSYGIPGYINNLWLIPRFLMKRRYFVYSLLFFILLTFTCIGSFYETHWVNSLVPKLDYMGNSKNVAIPYHAFPSMLMFTLLAFGKFMSDTIQNQHRVEDLEKQKLESELESLRSQINPHFLFNALNTIYGMARRTDEETASAIIKLSDILRHGLYECDENKILMEKELSFIRQYIEFAQLRLHDKDSIKLDIEADVKDEKIAPLLLIPFIENAMKHGLGVNVKDTWAGVHISIRDKELKFICENSNYIKAANYDDAANGSGIGLKNVKRRLELLYPGKYQLIITDKPEKFAVELQLQLS